MPSAVCFQTEQACRKPVSQFYVHEMMLLLPSCVQLFMHEISSSQAAVKNFGVFPSLLRSPPEAGLLLHLIRPTRERVASGTQQVSRLTLSVF